MGILGLPCILHPIEFGHNMISSKDLWKLISMPDHLLFHGPFELSIWPNSFGCNMHGRPNILIIYVKVKIRVMKAEARSFHEDWWWDIFSFTYIMGILGLPCILHPIEFGHNMISSKDLWKLISMPDHLLFHGPLELSIWPNSFGCNMHGRPNILIIYVKVKVRCYR